MRPIKIFRFALLLIFYEMIESEKSRKIVKKFMKTLHLKNLGEFLLLNLGVTLTSAKKLSEVSELQIPGQFDYFRSCFKFPRWKCARAVLKI